MEKTKEAEDLAVVELLKEARIIKIQIGVSSALCGFTTLRNVSIEYTLLIHSLVQVKSTR